MSSSARFPHEEELARGLAGLADNAASSALMKECAEKYAEHPIVVSQLASAFLTVLSSIKIKGMAVTAFANDPTGNVKPSVALTKPVMDLNQARSIVEGCSMLAPRGKFTLAVLPASGPDGDGSALALVSCAANGSSLMVPSASVEHVLVLEKPKDSVGTVYIMLHLQRESPLVHGKQKLPCVLMQVKGKDKLDISHPDGSGARLQGASATVLCQLLGHVLSKSPETVNPKYFCGSKGGSSLGATHKVNPGYMFPLKSGIAFVEKPALFIQATDVARLELGRTNGPTSTFDMTLEVKDGSIHEFGMLPREELGCLTEYLTRRKFILGGEDAHKDKEERPNTGEDAHESESDSDEDDHDFDPEAGESSADEGGAACSEEEQDSSSNGGEDDDDDEDNEVQSNPSLENSSEESDYEMVSIEEKAITKRQRTC